jgi:hypothetical protein
MKACPLFPIQEVHSMKFGTFAKPYRFPMIAALALVGVWPSVVLAQHDHLQPPSSPHKLSAQQQTEARALVDAVRDATERFKDIRVAKSEGYGLMFGCVSGSDVGAMGLHYVNGSLLDDVIDVEHPEIVLYEPLPNGQVSITGVDYLVYADAWNAKHKDPPQLMGQLFHYFESPNRFGLPAFYTLHVWAWKDNPSGTFTNWNPTVSCDAFGARN